MGSLRRKVQFSAFCVLDGVFTPQPLLFCLPAVIYKLSGKILKQISENISWSAFEVAFLRKRSLIACIYAVSKISIFPDHIQDKNW